MILGKTIRKGGEANTPLTKMRQVRTRSGKVEAIPGTSSRLPVTQYDDPLVFELDWLPVPPIEKSEDPVLIPQAHLSTSNLSVHRKRCFIFLERMPRVVLFNVVDPLCSTRRVPNPKHLHQ